MTLVQEERRVVRIDAVDRERKDARAIAGVRRAEHVHPGLVPKTPSDPVVRLLLRRFHGVEADVLEVPDPGRGPQHPGVVL